MHWDYSRHYARFHPNTPEHDTNLGAMLNSWLANHLPSDKNTTMLDVGCGRGYAIAWLGKAGYPNVSGIDVDVRQVEFAQSRGIRVDHVDDSTEFLKMRPGAYGCVLLMDVLEHLPRGEDRLLLEAIHTALQPAGRLLCSVPNALSPQAAYWRHIDYTHQTTFTPESLEFLLSHTGFEIEHLRPLEIVAAPRFGFWPPTKTSLRWWTLWLSRFQPRLNCLGEFGWRNGWRMPLSPNLLAVCARH